MNKHRPIWGKADDGRQTYVEVIDSHDTPGQIIVAVDGARVQLNYWEAGILMQRLATARQIARFAQRRPAHIEGAA